MAEIELRRQFVLPLRRGSRQPLADAAKQKHEHELVQRRQDNEMLRQAELSGSIPAGFPDHLRPEAKRRIELARRRQRAEREAIKRLNARGEFTTAEAIQAEIERHPVAS